MNDVETLKVYAIEDLGSLKGDVFDRAEYSFTWIMNELPKVNDCSFYSNRLLQSELVDFALRKPGLCRYSRWRKWYLFWEAMSLRFARAYPCDSFRSEQSIKRWVGRQIPRIAEKAVRSAAWRFVRSDFKP